MNRGNTHRNGRTTTRRVAAAAVVAALGLVACSDDDADIDVDDTTVGVTTEGGQTPLAPGTSVPSATVGTTRTTSDTATDDSTEPTPVRGSVSNDAGGGTGP